MDIALLPMCTVALSSASSCARAGSRRPVASLTLSCRLVISAPSSTARLDKATLRYAQDDPSEPGFLQHFTMYHPRTAAVLSATTCPMFFVRGNHEDHAVLDSLEQQYT